MLIDKAELMERLENIFGDITDDGGCYVDTNNDYEWLSLRRIVDIINDCEEYDD